MATVTTNFCNGTELTTIKILNLNVSYVNLNIKYYPLRIRHIQIREHVKLNLHLEVKIYLIIFNI